MVLELAALPARIQRLRRRPSKLHANSSYRNRGRRWIQLSSAQPSSAAPLDPAPHDSSIDLSAPGPDAKFEVLGAPYSLLSASIAASQPLYTRRGTLIGLHGKPENVVSSLSLLGPFRRALLGIPFFYQKITSASPVTALIASKSPLTSFVVAHMDGTVDWMVAQRRALLAWTGQTLSIHPTLNTKFSLAHWGNSRVTGRGLLALVGTGQVYQVSLKAGEQYVAHPSNVIAYAMNQNPPLPYRFKSSVTRFQVPQLTWLSHYLSSINFIRVLRESDTWKNFTSFLFRVRTWARRTIWGDSLFMQFHGPTQILLQTRASRLGDVLTARDINEIADVEPGALQPAVILNVEKQKQKQNDASAGQFPSHSATQMSYASVEAGGKVKFQQS